MRRKIKILVICFLTLIMSLLFHKDFMVSAAIEDIWTGDWSIIGDINQGGFVYMPRGIAIDSTGTVYTTQPASAQVKMANPDGWRIVPNCPFTQGQDIPWAVTVDKYDNLYVTNNVNVKNGVIWKYTSATQNWTDITNNYIFNKVEGIAVDSNLNVYVTDSANDKVLKLNNGSNSWTVIGDNTFTYNISLDQPTGIAADSNNNVFVTYKNVNGGGVAELKSGAKDWNFPDGAHPWFSEPGQIAIDKNDNIFAFKSIDNQINVLYHGTKEWSYIKKGTGADAFKEPYSIATDNMGNVYVADKDANGFGLIYKHQAFASKLVFKKQPLGSKSNLPLSQQPELWITDVNGNLMTGINDREVTLILTSANGAVINGTKTVALKDGKATFNNLSVSKAGTYTLTARVEFPKTSYIWDSSNTNGLPMITKTEISSSFTIEPLSAVVSPASASFDKNIYKQKNVSTAITWNDTSTVISVFCNGSALNKGTDYTLDGNTLVIKKEYLKNKTFSKGIITITFDKESQSTFTIDMIETQTINAIITPENTLFDKNPAKQADIYTTITWNDTSAVTGISYDGSSLTKGIDYTIDNNTLVIKKEYLSGLHLQSGAKINFTISFDIGNSAVATVTVMDSYVPGSDATLNNLKVGGSTIPGFASNIHSYSITVPFGTKTGEVVIEALQNDPKAVVKIKPAQNIPGITIITVSAENTTSFSQTDK